MNPSNYTLLDIYTTGVYNEVNEFTTMKALFKEVKIIRPLNISKIKQIDLNPLISLFEIKLENITSKINFIDRSLKNSKFLEIKETKEIDGNKPDTNNNVENEFVTNGINLTLRDVQILKEETLIFNKKIIWVKNGQENKIEMSQDNINLDNLNFLVVNNVRKNI